jgi:hypothetical protein
MTEPETTRLRRELLLEQALGAQLDALVRRANTTAALLRGQSRMDESQLRNLLNTALASRSVEVTANFVRYQIGRSYRTGDPGPWYAFGNAVIADLKALGETAKGIADELAKAEVAGAETLQHDAHVRLMQLYLGYLGRAFAYAKKTGDFERLTEVIAHGS